MLYSPSDAWSLMFTIAPRLLGFPVGKYSTAASSVSERTSRGMNSSLLMDESSALGHA